MKTIDIQNVLARRLIPVAVTLLAIFLVSGSLNRVTAQGSTNQVVEQAQEAVRQRIISQEGRRDTQDGRRVQTVRFNNDAQISARSGSEVRVRGTGIFLRSGNSRYNDPRYNDGRNNDSRNNTYRNDDRGARPFTYEATVNSRNSYRNVSAIRYNWQGNWASDDNTRGDYDRGDYNDGRNNNRGDYNDGRNTNRDGYGDNSRPNGRVSYSGPIMNRNSNKALDVTEHGMRDGDEIQQWSYADQPNQNWDVIDLGNGEVAIISRQSGKAITVQGGRDNNGATIIQRGWNDSRQQRWRMEKVSGDYYRIISVDNGKCLDVTQASKQDGASIQLWDYAMQSNQQWRLRR